MKTIEEISINYTPYIKGEMKLFREELEKEGYNIVFFRTFTNEYACKQTYIEYIVKTAPLFRVYLTISFMEKKS